MTRSSAFGALLLVSLLLAVGHGTPARSGSYPMRTLEGEVLSIGHHEGEGGLDLLQVQLGPDTGQETWQILLAPHEVCQQIGFEIEPGDRVRVRIFLDETDPVRVQKIQNLSRGTMVRLRTLHQTPLWSDAGSWQGGPIRTTMGRHRHGQERGGGPGR